MHRVQLVLHICTSVRGYPLGCGRSTSVHSSKRSDCHSSNSYQPPIASPLAVGSQESLFLVVTFYLRQSCIDRVQTVTGTLSAYVQQSLHVRGCNRRPSYDCLLIVLFSSNFVYFLENILECTF